jgi:uncharacterized protein YceK
MMMFSGCGTILGRSTNEPQVDYFKGLDGDMRLLGVSADYSDGHNYAAAIMCYFMFVCPLLTVVSLPLDGALDILLLPIDYANTL